MDYIQNGVEVTYSKNGETKADIIYLVDYKNVENNSFIFANQWTFIEKSNKRPDVLLFFERATDLPVWTEVAQPRGNRRKRSLLADP